MPPLHLPSGALSPRSQQYDVSFQGGATESPVIEHQLRLVARDSPLPRVKDLLSDYSFSSDKISEPSPWDGYSEGRKPGVVEKMEDVIEQRWSKEEPWFEGEEDIAPSAPWVTAYLEDVLQKVEEGKYDRIAQRDERHYWYTEMKWRLYSLFTERSLGKILDGGEMVQFEGVVVYDATETTAYDVREEYGTPGDWVYSKEEVADLHDHDMGALPPSLESVYEFPMPLVLCRFRGAGNYLFLPWTGGLVCPCPYKRSDPSRVACKHELAAAMALDRDGVALPIDIGMEVPARCRRLIDPAIATAGV